MLIPNTELGHIILSAKHLDAEKYASSAIREAVHVPVILTGGVTKANEAEALLEEGAADLIGVGRAIFKDADWAKKEMEE